MRKMRTYPDSYFSGLGLKKLPKVVLPRKEYSVYHQKSNLEGNVYSWNTHALDDMPPADLCLFYVEDWRFVKLMKNVRKANNLLSRFKYVGQPDYSVYYDLDLIDQIYRLWTANRVAHSWSTLGHKIVPNLVLGSQDLLPYTLYTIEKGSSFTVQIQAHSHSLEQDRVDEYTIKSALDLIQPEVFLVYGTQERIDALYLSKIPNMIVVDTLINNLRNGKKLK